MNLVKCRLLVVLAICLTPNNLKPILHCDHRRPHHYHHHQPSLTKKLSNVTLVTITEIAKIPAIQDHRVNQEKVLRHRDC